MTLDAAFYPKRYSKNAATELEHSAVPSSHVWKGNWRLTSLLSFFIAMTYPFSALAYYSGTNMRDDNFFARKTNGSVSIFGTNRLYDTWTCCDSNGNSYYDESPINNAISISTTGDAAAAILADGSVYTWGYFCCGDTVESNSVDLSSGFLTIASSYGAFAALKTGGAIVTWGSEEYV